LCLKEIAFAEARGDSACDATSTTVAIANRLRRDSKFIPLLRDLSSRSKSCRGPCKQFFLRTRSARLFIVTPPGNGVNLQRGKSNVPASTLGEVGVRRCRHTVRIAEDHRGNQTLCRAIVLPWSGALSLTWGHKRSHSAVSNCPAAPAQYGDLAVLNMIADETAHMMFAAQWCRSPY
jgi:hypothetical protein